MSANFSQSCSVSCDDPDELVRMLKEWDARQAETDIMGYMGTRLLADRERLGHYVIIADFGVVDPSVTAAEEATRNNRRPETKEFAARLLEIVDGAPDYHHYDELYRTDR